MEIILITLGLFFLAFLPFFYFIFFKKKKFGKDRKNFYLKKIKEIKQKDLKSQVIDFDILLDKLLGELGYTGTLGEKMKSFGKAFKNENKIWKSHKMRNNLVHNIEYKASEKEMKKSVEIFEKELLNIFM